MPSNSRVLGLTPREWRRFATVFLFARMRAAFATYRLVTLAAAVGLAVALEAANLRMPYSPDGMVSFAAYSLPAALVAFLLAEILMDFPWVHEALLAVFRAARYSTLAGLVVWAALALDRPDQVPNVILALFLAGLGQQLLLPLRGDAGARRHSTLFLETETH